MKRFLIGFVFICIAELCFSQEIITTKDEDLNGSVSKIEVYEVKYEDNFGEVVEGEKTLIATMEFDQNKRLISLEDTKKSDMYTFSDKNDLIEFISQQKDDTFEFLNKRVVISYSANKDKIMETYDMQNNLNQKAIFKKISSTSETALVYDDSGKQVNKEIYLYNNSGRMLKKEVIGKDGKSQSIVEQKYDVSGNMIYQSFVMSSGITNYIERKFNNENLVIELHCWGSVVGDYTEVYEYTLDNNKNWIEMKCSLRTTDFGETKLVPQRKQSRVISYN